MIRMLNKLSGWRIPETAIALALFAVSLSVYLVTLTPGLSYQSMDSTELATVPYTMALAHMPGYPLYTWLGKLFTYLPVGDVAHRMNLMSAVLAAGGVVFLYLIVRVLTRKTVAAVAAALIFAFSTTFWSQAVITEVYTSNVFMLTLTMLLLVKWADRQNKAHAAGKSDSASAWYFLGFAFSYGLSLGTHMSDLAFAPAFAIYVLLVDWRTLARPRLVIGAALVFILGCLQFVWLPLKAGTLRDALMVANAPDTLRGFYNYTLGAFSAVRFAFPLSQVPGRIAMYLGLLWQNFGPVGIFFLLIGVWSAASRQWKVFCFLMAAYLFEVAFFTQYNVPDVDVFFIPAHLIAAIFIGCGISRAFDIAGVLFSSSRAREAVASTAMSLFLLLPVAGQLHANFAANNESSDSIIEDFYNNVFRELPRGSTLLGWAGSSGYDMFYYRDVYNTRPDVFMPLDVPGKQPTLTGLKGRAETYSVVDRGQVVGQVLDADDFLVPILAAPIPDTTPPATSYLAAGLAPEGRPLRLYKVVDRPPRLVVNDAQPQHPANVELGGLRFVGYDMANTPVKAGKTVHLVLYWRVERMAGYLVGTRLGGAVGQEVHPLGFGNLGTDYFEKENSALANPIVAEEYDLVVPSNTAAGKHSFEVGVVDRAYGVNRFVQVGTLSVAR